MDSKQLLDEFKGKEVSSMTLTEDYQLQIEFEDKSFLEVIVKGPQGSKLSINCDLRIQRTL
jgi:hypothetical protein